LCAAQAAEGAQVILCSIDGDNAPQLASLKKAGVDVQLFPAIDNIVRFSPKMARYLKSLRDVDIIHNHGHWLWPNWYAPFAAKKLKSSLVTTPHGTLVPGMLARSSLKKKLAWVLFDNRLIRRAGVVHALSSAEGRAMDSTISQYSDNMIVVPNGVHMGKNEGQFTADVGGKLLFLSRVAPIKGVTQLLEAWSRLTPRFPNWELRIVGPVDASIERDVNALCKSINSVALVGPIYHEERWSEYRNAAGFILPTLGEGLPTVLLEAAAHKLPVITTKEANFDELYESGGSILTSPNADDIEATLAEFFSLAGKDRKAIGLRGASLIEANFDWSTIASRWIAIYEELRTRERR